MTPNKFDKGKQLETERVKRKRGSSSNENHHFFIFTKEEDNKMYEYLSRRHIIPTWYADDETLEALGLKNEVDRLLNKFEVALFDTL